jgi:hypothetical protein
MKFSKEKSQKITAVVFAFIFIKWQQLTDYIALTLIPCYEERFLYILTCHVFAGIIFLYS